MPFLRGRRWSKRYGRARSGAPSSPCPRTARGRSITAACWSQTGTSSVGTRRYEASDAGDPENLGAVRAAAEEGCWLPRRQGLRLLDVAELGAHEIGHLLPLDIHDAQHLFFFISVAKCPAGAIVSSRSTCFTILSVTSMSPPCSSPLSGQWPGPQMSDDSAANPLSCGRTDDLQLPPRLPDGRVRGCVTITTHHDPCGLAAPHAGRQTDDLKPCAILEDHVALPQLKREHQLLGGWPPRRRSFPRHG